MSPSPQPSPTPILACTISRDVQNFDLLIEDMELELGESWGDLSFTDALPFFDQPDGAGLEFVVLAIGGEDEGQLETLGEIVRGAKAKGIKVMLVADALSPGALHQLLRQGADEFVPYPLPDGALHDAVARLRQARPPLTPAAATETPAPGAAPWNAGGARGGAIIPVHGLAGGVGATTFAVNLAWELASINKTPPRVCLIDLNFQYGAVATYLDLHRREAVYEFLTDAGAADGESLRQALQSFGDKLQVFTAPAEMLPLDFVGGEEIGRLLDQAAQHFDFVIVDMPATVVAWTESVLTRAHIYFAPIELDLRSAQNVVRFVRALKAEGLPHEKLRYVLNRAPKFTDLSGKGRIKRMAESLEIAIELQMPDGGAQVTQANDHGQPLALFAAKNPLRREVQKLAQSLFDLTQTAEVKRRA